MTDRQARWFVRLLCLVAILCCYSLTARAQSGQCGSFDQAGVCKGAEGDTVEYRSTAGLVLGTHVLTASEAVDGIRCGYGYFPNNVLTPDSVCYLIPQGSGDTDPEPGEAPAEVRMHPFDMSAEDGGLVSAAICSVWFVGFGLRRAAKTLDIGDSTDD
jgi:hypothetical protein